MTTFPSLCSTFRRHAGRLLAAAMLAIAGTQAVAAGLVIGSKNFTEQQLLSELTAQYLGHKGFQVSQKGDLATVSMRGALESRQLDLVWDYTGTALIVYNKINERMTPEQAYDTVRRLDADKGLTWLNASALNNTYAFAMQRQRAEREGIRTLSDLVAKMNAVALADPSAAWHLGLDMEFAGRPDGLKPLQALYKLPLTRPQIRQMDPGLVYTAIRDGFVPAGLVYTTDGRVKGFDMVVLEDDLGFFPSYAATPVVRAEVLAQHPGLADALNTLSAALDNEAMSTMNARVDIEHLPVRTVAADFLRQRGLI